jgi:ABC-type lipoprotein release transport system permease subunit
MLLWKIAWRNLWRHKGKSFVIGMILFLGALFMTVGDALINGAEKGLEKNMIESFTGHLVVVAEKEKNKDVFFTNKAVEVIPDYQAVKAVLQQQELVTDFLPITRGTAMVMTDTNEPGFTFLIGVDFEALQKFTSNNVSSLEGDLLKPGDRGLLVPYLTRKQIHEQNGFWLLPENGDIVQANLTKDALADQEKNQLKLRHELVLMGFGGDGLENDIVAPVKGIVKFKTFNEVWNGLSFIDLESFRECFGYVTAADNTVELSQEQKAVLETDDLDALLDGAGIVEDTAATETTYNLETLQQQTVRTTAVNTNLDSGTFNIVLVKIQPGLKLDVARQQIEDALKAANTQTKVYTWKTASGEVAQFASITQGALYVFVIFIFFVAAIVIMNTLSMAAIERATEIGMMRAVGARKNFISRMFFAETTVLSAVFGGLGILAGLLIVWIVAALNISTTGDEFGILSLLVGGDTVHPISDLSGVITGIVQLAIVTVLAMIYPILVAVKITPLEAISRD